MTTDSTGAIISGAITVGVANATFGRGGILYRGRRKRQKTALLRSVKFTFVKFTLTPKGRKHLSSLKKERATSRSDFAHGLSNGINFLTVFIKPVTEKQALRKVSMSRTKLMSVLRSNIRQGNIRRVL